MLAQVLTRLETLFSEIKDLFETYRDVMKEKQKSLPVLPDFELDMSILDPEFLFKKDIYYEIRYKDPKLNRYDLLSFGGVYSVQVAKVDALKINDPTHNHSNANLYIESPLQTGSTKISEKKVSFGFVRLKWFVYLWMSYSLYGVIL